MNIFRESKPLIKHESHVYQEHRGPIIAHSFLNLRINKGIKNGRDNVPTCANWFHARGYRGINNDSLSSTINDDFVRHVSSSSSLRFAPLRFVASTFCVVYHSFSHGAMQFCDGFE